MALQYATELFMKGIVVLEGRDKFSISEKFREAGCDLQQNFWQCYSLEVNLIRRHFAFHITSKHTDLAISEGTPTSDKGCDVQQSSVLRRVGIHLNRLVQ